VRNAKISRLNVLSTHNRREHDSRYGGDSGNQYRVCAGIDAADACQHAVDDGENQPSVGTLRRSRRITGVRGSGNCTVHMELH